MMEYERRKNSIKFYKTILKKLVLTAYSLKEFNKALIGLSYRDSNELRKWKRRFVFEKFQNNYYRKSS